MKNSLLIGFSIVALGIAGHCAAGPIGLLTQKHRDWNFIQAVGGMKANLVERRLFVSCDVSGLKTITVKPTLVNSGIGVRKLRCSRVGNTIQLSVVTSVIEKGMRTDCGSVDLDAYPAGTYSVVYLDPSGTTHPVGDIELR
jgi:hypothetical protein